MFIYLFDDLNLKVIINNIKIAKNYINYSYLIIYKYPQSYNGSISFTIGHI
jgi:hypothetical protein